MIVLILITSIIFYNVIFYNADLKIYKGKKNIEYLIIYILIILLQGFFLKNVSYLLFNRIFVFDLISSFYEIFLLSFLSKYFLKKLFYFLIQNSDFFRTYIFFLKMLFLKKKYLIYILYFCTIMFYITMFFFLLNFELTLKSIINIFFFKSIINIFSFIERINYTFIYVIIEKKKLTLSGLFKIIEYNKYFVLGYSKYIFSDINNIFIYDYSERFLEFNNILNLKKDIDYFDE